MSTKRARSSNASATPIKSKKMQKTISKPKTTFPKSDYWPMYHYMRTQNFADGSPIYAFPEYDYTAHPLMIECIDHIKNDEMENMIENAFIELTNLDYRRKGSVTLSLQEMLMRLTFYCPSIKKHVMFAQWFLLSDDEKIVKFRERVLKVQKRMFTFNTTEHKEMYGYDLLSIRKVLENLYRMQLVNQDDD